MVRLLHHTIWLLLFSDSPCYARAAVVDKSASNLNLNSFAPESSQNSSVALTYLRLPISNLSAIPSEDIDPKFSVEYVWNPLQIQKYLSPNAVLSDANNAMCAMALESFNENMRETTWVLDKSPTVKIRAFPESPGLVWFPRKYAIWSLDKCIAHMIRSARFDGITCLLRYEGHPVARIAISKNDHTSVSTTATAPTQSAISLHGSSKRHQHSASSLPPRPGMTPT